MPLKDYLDVSEDAAKTALQFPFGSSTALNAAPGGDWEGMADIAGNVGMGALELGNSPFELAGEAIRGAGESEPLKMATANDQSGFRWPSIVQRLAPSTRTDQPPADPFMKSYQGLEGLVNLPGRGLQGASDVVTGQPDIAAQLGGLGMALGVTPYKPMATPEIPKGLMNERGGLTLGPGSKPPAQLPAASPWFSRLENTLEQKMPSRAPVQDVKNIISQGLPKEEIDWRGLNEFLETKHGPVSKEEVMGFLKEHPVEIGEKKLAGQASDYRRPVRGDEDLPREVTEKAESLQQEAADRAMEDFNFDPGPGYGIEPIDMTEANAERGTGQKDLWGKEIEPLPDKYKVLYDNEPVMHDDLSQYYAKKSVPDEEGHAIFANQDDAYEAFDDYTEGDRTSAQDEAYRDFLNENPVENYYEDAKAEVGYVPEEEGLESLPGGPGAGPTKFENYTTPGGENYREVLMTLPNENSTAQANVEKAHEILRDYLINEKAFGESSVNDYMLNAARGELSPGQLRAASDDPKQLQLIKALEHAYDVRDKTRNPTGVFQSGHWDEPNVLAHVRLKDYTDPTTGKKALLVDEIQSDWHQKGRAEGYKNPEVDKQIDMNNSIIEHAEAEAANIRYGHREEAKSMDKEAFDAFLYQNEPAYKQLMSQWVDAKNANVALQKQTGRLPNAPFKKNWHELAFKRALKEAAEGGYDEMVWTTGEQQADRYSLAKQVDKIVYNPKTKEFSAFRGDNDIINRANIEPKGLEDLVGKEVADKLLAQTPRAEPPPITELPEGYALIHDPNGDADHHWGVYRSDDPSASARSLTGRYHPSRQDATRAMVNKLNLEQQDSARQLGFGSHVLEGLDIKTGGEGMKGFYDEMLPSYANKYLKKYGVKVEEGTIETGERFKGRNRYKVTLGPGQDWDAFPTRELAEEAAKNMGGDYHVVDLATEEGATRGVHKIQITPEMKADILGKGQPMWQVPAMIGAGAAGAAAGAEGSEPQYAEGGIVQEETDMPFESQAQRGFMYAKHPKIAKRFEEETPKDAKLPEHVKKMNKGGVAGDWKDDLAGYMDQHFNGKEKPQNMAGGGLAGDFDVDLGDSSTARGAPYTPPPMPSPPSPIFNPKVGLPPPSPLPPSGPAVMAPTATPMPSAPPPAKPSGPDPLQSYLAEQRASLNRYGPEEQLALERQLHQQRTGFVPVLASAAGGFADALMQGVARAGPSNFQANIENRMDKTQEAQRSALKNAQTGHLARMKQEMELAQIDPASPISRLAQRSGTPLLKQLGLTDDEIRNIPASLIGEAQTKGLTLEEIRTKAEETRALREQNALLMGQGLDLRRESAAETARKARVDEAAKAKESRLGAAKDILTKSGNARLLGIPIPFTSDVSRKDKQMALDTLREGMQPDEGYEPDVLEYARTHGISPQAAQIQKQRRMRTPAGAR